MPAAYSLQTLFTCMMGCWVSWVLVYAAVVSRGTTALVQQQAQWSLWTACRLMSAYQRDAEQHGAVVMLNTCVVGGDVSGETAVHQLPG